MTSTLLLALSGCSFGGQAASSFTPTATVAGTATPLASPITAPAPTSTSATSIVAPSPPGKPGSPSLAPSSTPAGVSVAPSIGSAQNSVSISDVDDGKTIQMKVGQTLFVSLHAPQGFQLWEVAGPNLAVLQPSVNPAAAAVQGATLRAFKAIGAGTTSVIATTRPQCQPGQACPQIIRAYKVTVVVSAPAGG